MKIEKKSNMAIQISISTEELHRMIMTEVNKEIGDMFHPDRFLSKLRNCAVKKENGEEISGSVLLTAEVVL